MLQYNVKVAFRHFNFAIRAMPGIDWCRFHILERSILHVQCIMVSYFCEMIIFVMKGQDCKCKRFQILRIILHATNSKVCRNQRN